MASRTGKKVKAYERLVFGCGTLRGGEFNLYGATLFCSASGNLLPRERIQGADGIEMGNQVDEHGN
jgi:hypothetical protein